MTEVTIISLVRRILELDPTSEDPVTHRKQCWYCHAEPRAAWSGSRSKDGAETAVRDDPITDVGIHAADCVWLMARNISLWSGI